MTVELNNDEQHLLASLPPMIGGAMAMVGRSGLFGTGKEMFANTQALLEGAKTYPDNALIRAIVPDPTAADRNAEMAEMRATRDWSVARMKAKGIDSQDKMTEQMLADVGEAAGLLQRYDSETAAQYKAWVLAVAEKVAMASTEGGFLGFGGTRLSEAEQKLLGEIKTALGA